MVRRFRRARPWLVERLDALQAAGWTRARLFRAGRLRYPFGAWGVAWSHLWGDPRLHAVEVDQDGALRFILREPTGRETVLVSRP
jgi:hypothetical protein